MNYEMAKYLTSILLILFVLSLFFTIYKKYVDGALKK